MAKPSDELIDALQVRIAEIDGTSDRWWLIKRGYYYRPKAAGYTGCKDQAGIWTFAEASKHAGCASGEVSMHRADPIPYHLSMDAVHSAWEKLSEEDKHRFQKHLERAIIEFYAPDLWLIAAPAWLRCIALDRTMSKDPIL